MLVKYISLVPEIILLLSMAILPIVKNFRHSQTPKTYSSIYKISLILTWAMCIIFYNLSFNPEIYTNTLYTTFFKSILFSILLLHNEATCRWFLTQNTSSYRYYLSLTGITLSGCVAISSGQIGITSVALGILIMCTTAMFWNKIDENKKSELKTTFLLYGMIIVLLLMGGIWVSIRHDAWNYHALQHLYQSQTFQLSDYTGISCLLAIILSILGVAPFHFYQMQVANYARIPVAIVNIVVLPIIGLAVLLEIGKIFSYAGWFNHILAICGILSILFGSLEGEKDNVGRILKNVGLYNLGCVLLIISGGTISAISGGICFFLIYLVTMSGVYLCCYGIRSQGENLNLLNEWSGLAESKPYISAALLFFCASFIGLPPFAGLLGNLILIDNLLPQHAFGLLLFVFVMLVFMSRSLILIIKNIYAGKKLRKFDRADSAVYWGILLCAIFMIGIIGSPENMMKESQTIVENMMQIGR